MLARCPYLLACMWLLLVASPIQAQTRGYVGRVSGFDLDFDGVIGETSGADVAVCDGQNDASSTTGEDIDGNTVNDRQVYVNLASGTNNTTCGLPGTPCLTAQYALNGTNTAVTGGPIAAPSATQIQAVCVRGQNTASLGSPAISLTQNGAAGSSTRTATGNQVRAFEYPRYPFLVSGWDVDNDNSYPPFDADDTAVFDGNATANNMKFMTNDTPESRFEIAHLTVRDFGLACTAGDEGFFEAWSGGAHIYLHDLALDNNFATCGNGLGIPTYVNPGGIVYAAFENSQVTNEGGFIFHRGSAADQSGPLRIQNVSYSGSTNTDLSAIFKTWGLWTGIEVLDSVMDLSNGNTPPAGSPQHAVAIAQCSQDWDIVNNTMLNFRSTTIHLQPAAVGGCTSRVTTDIRIDRNSIRSTVSNTETAASAIQINGQDDDPGAFPNLHIGDVQITNNFISNSVANSWQSIMLSDAGHNDSCASPITGSIAVVNNTFDVNVNGAGNFVGGITLENFNSSTCRQQDYLVHNNIFLGWGSGEQVMSFDFAPSGFIANFNIYPTDALAEWLWNNVGQSTLAGWRTATGDDANSTQCAPSLVDPATGDYHLLTGDTCAQNLGSDQSAILNPDWDYDGTTRPQSSAWDIGGDEFAAGGSPVYRLRFRVADLTLASLAVLALVSAIRRFRARKVAL